MAIAASTRNARLPAIQSPRSAATREFNGRFSFFPAQRRNRNSYPYFAAPIVQLPIAPATQLSRDDAIAQANGLLRRGDNVTKQIWWRMVARFGIEPSTRGFSERVSD